MGLLYFYSRLASGQVGMFHFIQSTNNTIFFVYNISGDVLVWNHVTTLCMDGYISASVHFAPRDTNPYERKPLSHGGLASYKCEYI